MPIKDDQLEEKKDYLERLARNLVNLGEKGFRKLCEELGDDYDSLPGNEIALRTVQWIDKLEGLGLIPKLVHFGKVHYVGFFWDDPAQMKQHPPRKYFVASALKDMQTLEQFKIIGNRFERTFDPKKADYLIFDLDHPPADWIKFLGAQEHVWKDEPYYETTVFVQLKSADGQELNEVQLDGGSIFRILRKLFPKGYDFNMCSTNEEMLLKLSTLEDNRWKREQIDKALSRQAMASIRQDENQ